jgi:hypothetical protein
LGSMLLIMFLLYTTAHASIRKQCFEAFWYTHHLVYPPFPPRFFPIVTDTIKAFFFMIGLYTHATGCFVRDSVDPDYISSFPFYSTDHCLGYESWRFTIWAGILVCPRDGFPRFCMLIDSTSASEFIAKSARGGKQRSSKSSSTPLARWSCDSSGRRSSTRPGSGSLSTFPKYQNFSGTQSVVLSRTPSNLREAREADERSSPSPLRQKTPSCRFTSAK